VALENFGAKHVRTALAHATLAHVLLLKGHYEDAAAKLRSIIDITRRAGWQAGKKKVKRFHFFFGKKK
jgi:thioredoxin-like negative regulator of GroEL